MLLEIENSTKHILNQNNPEFFMAALELYSKIFDIETRLEETKIRENTKKDIELQALKNKLNITLINNGYDTIDEVEV